MRRFSNNSKYSLTYTNEYIRKSILSHINVTQKYIQNKITQKDHENLSLEPLPNFPSTSVIKINRKSNLWVSLSILKYKLIISQPVSM